MSKPIWVDVVFDGSTTGMIDFSKVPKIRKGVTTFGVEVTYIYMNQEDYIPSSIISPTFEELQELLRACSTPIKSVQYDWDAISGLRLMETDDRKPEAK